MATLAGGLLLVACAEEAAGPQFASDPRPTQSSTVNEVDATPVLLPTVAPNATPVSVAELLQTRGAPSRIFVMADDAIWAVSGGGKATRLLQAPAGARLVGFAPSPSADQVAVLLESEDPARRQTEVVILDADGTIAARLQGIASGRATPDAEPAAAAADINWSPQGDRILVSFGGTDIVTLPVDTVDGSPGRFANESGEAILHPSWSPTGEEIAFVSAAGGERDRSLRILDMASGETRIASPSSGERVVVEFAWMPDGGSLLFTESGQVPGAVSGIDLWRVDATGENRALVASAGAVAPVARITDVRPSPDGRAVAYAVLVPGPDGPRAESVWVRDLTSGAGFRVALPAVDAVHDIWWTDQGLLIAVAAGGEGDNRSQSFAVLQVDQRGAVSVIWTAPRSFATPVSATPQASPVGA